MADIYFDLISVSFVSRCNQWISPVRWSEVGSPGKLFTWSRASVSDHPRINWIRRIYGILDCSSLGCNENLLK